MRPDLPISLGEFRAWLDGYSESFTADHPNQEQWYVILDRLDQITGTANVYKAKSTTPPPGSLQGIYGATTIPLRAI